MPALKSWKGFAAALGGDCGPHARGASTRAIGAPQRQADKLRFRSLNK
jgi:hypothetical protein